MAKKKLFDKTDPNVTGLVAGVALINDSRSVETQDTVILTATGSRPYSRASNTIANTQEMDTVILSVQEEPP